MAIAAPATRYVEPTICQVARSLPSSELGWTYHPWLEFMGGGTGADQDIGSASFRMTTGARTAINQTQVQLVSETGNTGDPTGKLVRALVRDDAGDIELYGTTWSEAFVGKIIGRAVQPQGKNNANNGSDLEYAAAGMGAFLDQVYINRGYALSSDGTTVVDPGYCPRFNHVAGGDRSVTTKDIGGASVYVHAPYGTNKWTARQILELILATFARPPENVAGTSTGWEWAVSDPDGCLLYEPQDLDLDGMTVFQAVVTLCGQRRGMTFTLRPVGDAVTVLVRSVVATPITVGAYTLPASTVTTTFDMRSSLFYDRPTIVYDHSSVYDVIELRGARPLIGITVDSAQWTDGWSGTQETAWDTDPTALNTEPVHRLYYLQDNWFGRSASLSTAGLRSSRPVETSPDYGENGRDGSREFTDPTIGMTARAFIIDRMLPCSEGFGLLPTAPRQPPIIITAATALAYTAPGWEDPVATLGWTVQMESERAGIRLDDGDDGANIKVTLTTGKIAATIGIREHLPLVVSWWRPQAEWPCAMPRLKTIDVPQCEQHIVLDGTVTGLSASGQPVLQSGDLVVRDDVPSMRALLALYRAFFSEPSVNAEITDRSIIDTSAARRPGTLVTTITTGEKVYTVNAVITSRRYARVVRDGVPMFDTVYGTRRVIPDLEAML